uniref:Uncharacterized protein n=1 Tax=Ascaris lumbricoides TaxID=6252 RepID=A0A0M3IMU3_ASCLU
MKSVSERGLAYCPFARDVTQPSSSSEALRHVVHSRRYMRQSQFKPLMNMVDCYTIYGS